MCLIVAMMLLEKANHSPYNFATCFRAYSVWAPQSLSYKKELALRVRAIVRTRDAERTRRRFYWSSSPICGCRRVRPHEEKAFDNLLEQRIIKQVSNKGSATKVSKELRMVRLLFLPSQVESAVEQLQRLAEPVRQWALQGVVDLRAVL